MERANRDPIASLSRGRESNNSYLANQDPKPEVVDSETREVINDENFYSTVEVESIDDASNRYLISQGIFDTSPEIISLTRFNPMYDKEYPKPEEKNSNFNFFLFQSQLDLTIKEIINQTIENNSDLKEEVISNYQEKLLEFLRTRDSIQEYYLNFINLLNMLSLERNMPSSVNNKTGLSFEFKETGIEFETAFGTAQVVQVTGQGVTPAVNDVENTIISDSKRYGFNFDQNTIVDFINENIDFKGENKESILQGNMLYRACVRFVFDSWFGFPNIHMEESLINNFEISSDGYPLTSYRRSDGARVSVKDSTAVARQINIVSRGSQINSLRNGSLGEKFSAIVGDGSLEFSEGIKTFKDYYDLGESKIGRDNDLNAGGQRLIDKCNLLTEDQKFVQVFNSVLDPDEPVNRFVAQQSFSASAHISGRRYFSADITNRTIDADDDFTILNYSADMIEKIKNLESLLFSYKYKIRGSNYFNSFIKNVADIVHDTLQIKNLRHLNNSNLNDEEKDQPFLIEAEKSKNIYGALTVLKYLSTDDYSIKFFEYEQGVSYSNSSFVSNYNFKEGNLYALITFDTNDSFSNKAADVIIDLEKDLSDTFSEKFVISNSSLKSAGVEWCKLDTNVDIGQVEDAFASAQFYAGTLAGQGTSGAGFRTFITRLFRFFKKVLQELGDDAEYAGRPYALDTSVKLIHYIFQKSSVQSGELPFGSVQYYFFDENFVSSCYFFSKLASSSSARILNKDDPSDASNKGDHELLLKKSLAPLFFSYNFLKSMKEYFLNLSKNISQVTDGLSKVYRETQLEYLDISNIGAPTIEKLVTLENSYKEIFLPTTCFSENPSYFTYHNSRCSNDMIAINSFHRANSNSLNNVNVGGIVSAPKRIAVVGIPDGLINRLRYQSGRDTDHSIVEISLFSLDHTVGGEETSFTCRHRFLFNTCLFVNTVNPNIDLKEAISKESDFSFEDLVNIDNRQGFSDFNLNETDLFSFNFGRIENNKFVSDTVRSFDDAILYNKKYKIIPNTVGSIPEYNFNNSMSAEIIKNHVQNYILFKNSEVFGGGTLREYSYEYFDELFTRGSLIDGGLFNRYFPEDYSPDLRDYIERTLNASPVYNPDIYFNKAYSFNKFERVFFLPCYNEGSENYSFKSLIPFVRLL